VVKVVRVLKVLLRVGWMEEKKEILLFVILKKTLSSRIRTGIKVLIQSGALFVQAITTTITTENLSRTDISKKKKKKRKTLKSSLHGVCRLSPHSAGAGDGGGTSSGSSKTRINKIFKLHQFSLPNP
jgi:hypothetical protein